MHTTLVLGWDPHSGCTTSRKVYSITYENCRCYVYLLNNSKMRLWIHYFVCCLKGCVSVTERRIKCVQLKEKMKRKKKEDRGKVRKEERKKMKNDLQQQSWRQKERYVMKEGRKKMKNDLQQQSWRQKERYVRKEGRKKMKNDLQQQSWRQKERYIINKIQ